MFAGSGFVIPELRAMGYSRGRLVEPVCGKNATTVTFSGAAVMTGLLAAKMNRLSSMAQCKTKHMASFLGAKL